MILAALNFAMLWRGALYGTLGLMLVLMLVLFLIGKVPLSYNIRNLAVRWKTTVVTALAFTLVTGLLTVTLEFVNGMYALTKSSGKPGNVVILASGSTDEGFSTLAFGDVTNIERNPEIVQDAAGRRLASKELYVVANQQVPQGEGNKPRRRFVQIRGLEDPAVASFVHGLSLLPGGNWFSEAGIEAAGDSADSLSLIQAVLGSGIADELGTDRPDKHPLEPGDTFVLADRIWKVVGVLDSRGSTFDSEIWAKMQIVGEQFGKRSSYSSLVVRAENDDKAAELANALKESKDVAVNAIPEIEYFANLDKNSVALLVSIGVVTAFMALGGMFGVMNTMFAAISQRIKDIGVLRILGFKRRQLLISFLLESLCIALVGGLIGCALGSLCNGLTTKSIVSGATGGGKTVVLQMRINLEILSTGLLTSLMIGAIGGFFPALSAMLVWPLESLR